MNVLPTPLLLFTFDVFLERVVVRFLRLPFPIWTTLGFVRRFRRRRRTRRRRGRASVPVVLFRL